MATEKKTIMATDNPTGIYWRVRYAVDMLETLYDLDDCSYDADIAMHEFTHSEIERFQAELKECGYVYRHGQLLRDDSIWHERF